MTPVRGKIVERGGLHFFATVHPAIVAARPSQGASLRADFKRLGKLLRGEATEPAQIDWKICDLIDDTAVDECIAAMQAAGRAAFDIETTGLDPHRGEILMLGISVGARAWCFPIKWPGYGFSLESLNGKLLLETLSAVEAIAHNGKFDCKWLKHHSGGVGVRLSWDTMLAAYLLDENGAKGLKPLAKLHFDADDYELPQPMVVDGRALVDLEKAAQYCCLDTHYTYRLRELQEPAFEKDPRLKKLLLRLLVPASRVLESVELEGVYIDGERLDATLSVSREDVEAKQQALNTALGREVNGKSPKQVGEALRDKGVLFPDGAGKISTSVAALSLVAEDSCVKALMAFREAEKRVEFLESWHKKRDAEGYLHPGFNLAKTVTGRLSSDGPNFQQVPKETELRSLFCAPEGMVLIEADYSQGELRLAAEESGDSRLIEIYQGGGDVHTSTAAAVLAKPVEHVTADDRQIAKSVNFGFIYGMGGAKYVDYARINYGVEISEEAAWTFRSRFFSMYRELEPWHERRRREAKRDKHVRSAFGRVRRLPDVDSPVKAFRAEALRQAINAPIQSWLSDLMLFSFVRLAQHEWLRGVGLVHDAGIWYAPVDRVNEACALIKRTLEDVKTAGDVFGFSIRRVPMISDLKVGAWGSGVKWTQ